MNPFKTVQRRHVDHRDDAPSLSAPLIEAGGRPAQAHRSETSDRWSPGVTPPTVASRRLHRKRAADYIGTSLSWLDKSRLRGDGPAYLQIGGRVVYDTADLDEYLAKWRRQSTSERR